MNASSTAARRSIAELARLLLADPPPNCAPLSAPQALLASLPALSDPQAAQGILDALQMRLSTPEILDTAWAAWAETRHPGLLELLLTHARPAGAPPTLVVLSALRLNQTANLQERGAEIVEPLLALCAGADALLAARASAALRKLAQPAARSEVCRWVIEHDNPHARQAALESGYAPSDIHERALFYILSQQWEKYEALDFDRRLLETVYAAANESLRAQIAGLARQAGWSGFVQAIASGRSARRLGEMNEYEWEAVLAILGREQRWEDAWRLAQSAPPAWSARLLRSLSEGSWSPANVDAAATDFFARLCAAAEAALASGAPAGRRVTYRAALYGHNRQITALAVHPQGNLLASASADRSIRIWRIPEGRYLRSLEGHADFVLALAMAPNGEWLASSGADKTVRLWHMPDGAPRQVLGGHAGRVGLLAVSPNGDLLASGDERSIHIWQTQSGARLAAIRNQFNALNNLAITANRLLVSGDGDRVVKLWSLPRSDDPEGDPGGELVRSLLTPIVGWAVAPDGRSLASSSSYSSMQLWRIPGGEILRHLPGRANNTLLSFSPNGRWLAIADRSNVLLWDLHTEDAPLILKGGVGLTSSLAFSPDSQVIAAGCQGRTVHLWQIPGGALLKTLEGYNTPIRHLAFTPLGDLLISSDELSIHLWSVDDLGTVYRTPAGQLAPEQLESRLTDPDLPPAQRPWLTFSLELARWLRRFDIEVQEGFSIPVGDFDIEIAQEPGA